MSVWVMPRSPYSSAKHGISISTPLVVPSVRRTCGARAKPTTAILRSVIAALLQVVLVAVVVGVRFTGRPEVVDVVDAEVPFLTRFPHRLDPHAHPDLRRVDLGDQVQERDVGTVEQHVGRDVRLLDTMRRERDVDDRDRGDRALVWKLDEFGSRFAGGGVGAVRWE